MAVKQIINSTYNGLSTAYYEYQECSTPKEYAKHVAMSETTRRALQMDYAKACSYNTETMWEFMQEPKESFMCMEVVIDERLRPGEVVMSRDRQWVGMY